MSGSALADAAGPNKLMIDMMTRDNRHSRRLCWRLDGDLLLLSGVARIPLRELIREIWPFIIVLIITLLIMVLVPDVVLYGPRLAGYTG